ncbi:MAG: methylaspartate mutase accessory protein GlmL [Defluviitaleaceae bacterium]|nr:methylaspartate mutase accessory protein GlmL [Defluviitaleaceae bacterium]
MKIYLLTDFGSTYTKVTAIDVEYGTIVAFGKAFTTIEDDVTIGYNNALSQIYQQLGQFVLAASLACSSAAGGLKMVSSGLVPDLTAKASRLAAASAGAKVMKTYSYELTEFEIEEIEAINPDIVLLSGGIDGGNKAVILHNASIIAKVAGEFFVIVAGNRSAATQAREILEAGGKKVVVCENVMPAFGKLNIMPAKAAIRDLFIANIITAKGLDKAAAMMDMEIIPTPLAVFEACELLSNGTKAEKGLGELMAYDLGGATTDVYSMADGMPKVPNSFISGINEPFAKRSVEGDLGMRYSLTAMYDLIVEEDGGASFCTAGGFAMGAVQSWLEICRNDPSVMPHNEYAKYADIDASFAAYAIRVGASRHVGRTQKIYTPNGEMLSQEGKDLTQVRYVIGSGGAVINAQNPLNIMKEAIYSPRDLNDLKPLAPKILLDERNCLAAMGLLARREPDMALRIMKDSFVEIG